MKRTISILFILFFGMLQTSAADRRYGVRIIGREVSVVQGSEFTVGDIAEIKAGEGFKEKAARIAKVKIGDSPTAGRKATVKASTVLSAIRESGITLDSVGYFLPKTFVVKRDSRILSQDEIKAAIQEFLRKTDPGTLVSRVIIDKALEVPSGEIALKVDQISGEGREGAYRITAVLPEGTEHYSFLVKALLEKWVNVPIARYSIRKGQVVGEGDVALARLNIKALPPDIIVYPEEVLGREVRRQIKSGQVFRKRELRIPPLIKTGERVTVIYEKGLLTATATGIAIQEGIKGDLIRVRNEDSHRVIMARIAEPGIVRIDVR
ncbi:MAG: flagella basal body P-ring formation protein FlgA [Candidatus Dadabacteria bacterium]|nr:MAG: flagella basal body P-ring formation protein FlgA [Candidatus Dadabacteria bacterium]